MDKIDVCYANNKSGTYVQFMLPVLAAELEELNVYDDFLRESIRNDFKVLFDVYDCAFTTTSSYVIYEKGRFVLMSCLQGETTSELEETLAKIGVERRGFNSVESLVEGMGGEP